MKIENKNIIIYGLGISGLSALKALSRYNCNVTLVDSKTRDELKDVLKEVEDLDFKMVLGGERPDLSKVDLLVKSPGIALDNPLIVEAEKRSIDIISDLELAYFFSKTDRIICVTGTNGKTTVSSMLGEILSQECEDVRLAGNIGVGLAMEMEESTESTSFVVEASSFQLNNIEGFRPYVSVITNLSPDHLDWHGSYENYIEAKKNIFKNQKNFGYIILNYDDILLREMASEMENVFFFSSREILDQGVYIRDKKVYIRDQEELIEVLSLEGVDHIAENVLASIAASYKFGISINSIRRGILNMESLEHRIERFKEYRGVNFYNDSKGTNPESTIKALEVVSSPIILIAGGYNKGSDFTELSMHYGQKLKHLILMGQTGDLMKEAAIKAGFNSISMVANMEEAVDLSMELMNSGDNILLSPACASWGVYKNFEERGREFKNLVEKKVVIYEEGIN